MAAQRRSDLPMDSIEQATFCVGKLQLAWLLSSGSHLHSSPQGTAFKGRIDLNYVGSEDRLKKHSALVITKPLLTDSGNYTCYVQTLQSNARKTAEMLIIGENMRQNWFRRHLLSFRPHRSRRLDERVFQIRPRRWLGRFQVWNLKYFPFTRSYAVVSTLSHCE